MKNQKKILGTAAMGKTRQKAALSYLVRQEKKRRLKQTEM